MKEILRRDYEEEEEEEDKEAGSKVTIFVWRVSESPIEGRMMDTQLFRFSDRRSGHRSLPGSYKAHWID